MALQKKRIFGGEQISYNQCERDGAGALGGKLSQGTGCPQDPPRWPRPRPHPRWVCKFRSNDQMLQLELLAGRRGVRTHTSFSP